MRPNVGDSMSGKTKIDTSEVAAFIKKAELTERDMLTIEKPAALTIINQQRQLVPVDTGATKLSIGSQIIVSTAKLVTDHIGPSTLYAPFIEFGVISKPNYPMQPFVRPSVMGRGVSLVVRVADTAFKKILQRKHG